MFHSRLRTPVGLFVAASLGVGGTSHALTSDLSDDPLAPTVIGLIEGSNAVGGSVVASGSGAFNADIDFFTVVVPVGLQLDSVLLSRYEAPAVSFMGFSAGPLVPADPSAGTAEQMTFSDNALGFALVGQTLLGSNLLTNLADGNVTIDPVTDPPTRLLEGNRRFDPSQPLGAGSYAFVFQDTGPVLVTYELDFITSAVPEPGAAAAFAVLCLARRRYRRSLP